MDVLLARTSLGQGPDAVLAGRRTVRRALDGVLDRDTVDTLVLLTSELVTNATLHVGGAVELVLRARPGVVRLEVHDTGVRLPVPRRALDRERTSGRGLHLVDLLSARWGSEPEDGGKLVWCEVEVAT